MNGQKETSSDHKPRHVHRLVIRRRWRVVISIALGLIAGAMIGGVFLYIQSMRMPSWIRKANAEADAPGRLDSNNFENAVMNECTKVRPVDPARREDEPWRSEPWAISIDPVDLNNWIDDSGLRWAAHQKSKDEQAGSWPRGLRTIRIGVSETGQVRLAATVHDRAGSERTVGLITAFRIADDGLWLDPSRIEVGELSLSASWALERAQAAMKQVVPANMQALPEVQTVLSAARGETPLIVRPLIRLPDGRKVRILAIEAEGQRLIVTCRTEGRK